MRWFNRYNFPYSNFHDLNLDWIIKEMTRVVEEWEAVKAEWEAMKLEWAEFQAEMQRLWQEYKDLMNAAWEAYQNELNSQWEEYKTNLNAEWDAYKAELNQAFEDYKTDLTNQWNTYKTELNQAFEDYQNTLNTWKDGVDSDITDKFDELDEKCAECMQTITDALVDLNSQWNSFKTYVENYLDNLPYQNIIHDTTVEWLDEHGVTIEQGAGCIMLEDFGAVGDGETDDSQAWEDAMSEISRSGKILVLGRKKIYNLGTYASVDAGTTIIGNNADLRVDNLVINSYSTISRLETRAIQLAGSFINLSDIMCSSITNRTGSTTSVSNRMFMENIYITPGSKIGYNLDLYRYNGVIDTIYFTTNNQVLINAEACQFTLINPKDFGNRTIVNASYNADMGIASVIDVIGYVNPNLLIKDANSTIRYTSLETIS